MKGAFTGADHTRRGYFELAHRGTLFLDEVAELPTHLQAKLLWAIEDRTVQPVGSESSISIDVRLIAATNRDLASDVEKKRFREDLYYRLNVITLTLPALRDRVEDIPEIAQSYVEHYRVLTGSDVKGISSDALRTLTTYPWPGNIRELSNALERAVIMATRAEIQVEDLPVAIQEYAPPLLAPHESTGLPEANDEWLLRPWAEVRRKVLEETELRYLRGLLKRTRGRVGEAARQAGMDPRSLHPKLKKHGLRKEDYR
jgi:DNA-binding NtrC family response regulator